MPKTRRTVAAGLKDKGTKLGALLRDQPPAPLEGALVQKTHPGLGRMRGSQEEPMSLSVHLTARAAGER